jgi:hypothetical protein
VAAGWAAFARSYVSYCDAHVHNSTRCDARRDAGAAGGRRRSRALWRPAAAAGSRRRCRRLPPSILPGARARYWGRRFGGQCHSCCALVTPGCLEDIANREEFFVVGQTPSHFLCAAQVVLVVIYALQYI